ncbi:50S ribosomal protein L19 [Candidatus Gottesmanbacteria bacterium]|nr:50S ribosomal protein L19 [Candidatus Gottesmanbacteria bacterium]
MANQTTWTSGEGDNRKTVAFRVGDTIRVHYKLIEHEKVAGKTKREVKEETRERTQLFEGIVLSVKGSGANAMFTVRHMGIGAIGIERIFPLISPWIRKIDVKKRGDVRRAKLYYLRSRHGKAATRIDETALHIRPAVAK